MTRTLLYAAAAGAAVAAAAAPKALAGVEGGLWEVSGLSGARSAVQQCVADPLKLVEVGLPAGKCSETVLSEAGASVRVSIQCAGGSAYTPSKNVRPLLGLGNVPPTR